MDAPKSHKALLKLALPITHGIVNVPGSFCLKTYSFKQQQIQLHPYLPFHDLSV